MAMIGLHTQLELGLFELVLEVVKLLVASQDLFVFYVRHGKSYCVIESVHQLDSSKMYLNHYGAERTGDVRESS